MVVSAVVVLLSTTLIVMLWISQRATREEAFRGAEQTLEGMVQHIDNILLSVEQSTGNIYWDLLLHLDQPEKMSVYARKLLESNPYATGAAIAFEPYYYKDRGQLFMIYVHRDNSGADAPITESSTFGNTPYIEQAWYQLPMKEGRPYWLNPIKASEANGESIISFCLPIYSPEGKAVGVVGVDLALKPLSKIVLAAKPSANSYATLLGSDGSYIIHPDSNKVKNQSVYTVMQNDREADIKEAADAMMAGETGYKRLHLNGIGSYIFYKPFKRSAVPGRSMEELDWSLGIVYPISDIFGSYYHLVGFVVAIAVAGILLLFILCRSFTHRQLLPLRLLTKSAQRIADGKYDEPIPDSRQIDEVGQLQDHFQQMQQALASNVGELERQRDMLRERNEVLRQAYEQAKEANRVKTAVLHNMTDQINVAVGVIASDVTKLHQHYKNLEQEEAGRLVDDIEFQSKAVTDMLDELLKAKLPTTKQK